MGKRKNFVDEADEEFDGGDWYDESCEEEPVLY
jgi:hypothetical protein